MHTSAIPCESLTWLAVRRTGKLRVWREVINLGSRERSNALSWFKGSTLNGKNADEGSEDEEQHIRNSHHLSSAERSTETVFLFQQPGDDHYISNLMVDSSRLSAVIFRKCGRSNWTDIIASD